MRIKYIINNINLIFVLLVLMSLICMRHNTFYLLKIPKYLLEYGTSTK